MLEIKINLIKYPENVYPYIIIVYLANNIDLLHRDVLYASCRSVVVLVSAFWIWKLAKYTNLVLPIPDIQNMHWATDKLDQMEKYIFSDGTRIIKLTVQYK